MGKFKAYWQMWLWRDALSRLITINTIAWLLIATVTFAIEISGGKPDFWLSLFAMPTALTGLAVRTWTPLVYMFCGFDFLNVLVNMMWLLLFGRLLMMRCGGMRLAALYVYGGLAGALFTVILTSVTGQGSWLVGASAAVLAVATAVAVLMPRMKVPLFLFGNVQLIWIYLVCVLFFVVLPLAQHSPGVYTQAVAHMGGIAVGGAFALLMPRVDITRPYAVAARRVLDLFRCKPAARSPFGRVSRPSRSDEAALDALLDKVHRSGYQSLSPHERQRLFELSQRIRR